MKIQYYILLFIPWLCAAQSAQVEQKRQELISAFDNYRDIREATGNNDGGMLDRLNDRCGSYDKAPWCSCLQMNLLLDVGVKSSLTPQAASGFVDKYKLPKEYYPKPASYAGYHNGKRISHIELYKEDLNETHVITLAGNVGLKGGGEGTREKIVPKHAIYIYSDILAAELSSIETEYANPHIAVQKQPRAIPTSEKPSEIIKVEVTLSEPSPSSSDLPSKVNIILVLSLIVITIIALIVISKLEQDS